MPSRPSVPTYEESDASTIKSDDDRPGLAQPRMGHRISHGTGALVPVCQAPRHQRHTLGRGLSFVAVCFFNAHRIAERMRAQVW